MTLHNTFVAAEAYSGLAKTRNADGQNEMAEEYKSKAMEINNLGKEHGLNLQ